MSTGTSKIVNLYAFAGVSLQFKGIADTNTDPGSPVNPEYWIASGPGTYVNFDNLVITGDIAFLVFDGQSWQMTEFEIGSNNHVTYNNVNSNRVFSNVIPAGKVLHMIVIENETANVAQLSMGKSTGEMDVFGSEAIDPNESTIVNIKPSFDRNNVSNLYIHDGGDGDIWNEVTLKITFIFIKI